jgi:CubicO group peptidase (beta-lactamase class C family)
LPVWQRAAPESEAVDPRILSELDRRIRVELQDVTSFLVARNGRLIFERYYGGVQAADRLPVFSVTKSVVSALVGIAVAERKLASIDERVVDLLPEGFGSATSARARAITLRHLLTMSAGFGPNYSLVPEDPVRALINRPLFADPGTTFGYDSGSSDLLSAVVTRATGMPAAQYAQLRLFGPLGIRGAGWGRLAPGVSRGASGLHLRPRDLLAFGQLYLDGGKWRGRQIVPSAWARAATRTQIRLGGGRGYGFNWWTERGPPRFFAAYGYLGQAIVVFPRLHEVVVTTASAEVPKRVVPLAQAVARGTHTSR